MKLAFCVHVDVDESAFPRSQVTGRDPLTEHIRDHLSTAAEMLPVPLQEVRVWGRGTPTKQQPLPRPTTPQSLTPTVRTVKADNGSPGDAWGDACPQSW